MQEASPPRMLQRREHVELAPTLILHGTTDMNVPIAQVEDFAGDYGAAFLRQRLTPAAPADETAAVYRTAGAVVELAEFPGMPHCFLHPAVATGPQAGRGLEVLQEFIAQRLAGG